MKQLLKTMLIAIAILFIKTAMAQIHPCNGPRAGERVVGEDRNGNSPIQLCDWDNSAGNNNYPPPVRWADQWGAIVIGWHPNTDGIVGKASSMINKHAAETAALQDCKLQGGGNTCYVAVSYYNQCAALAVGIAHGAGTASGPNLGDVKQRAIKACTKGGGKNCEVIYSDCSMAVRVQ